MKDGPGSLEGRFTDSRRQLYCAVKNGKRREPLTRDLGLTDEDGYVKKRQRSTSAACD